MKKLFAVSIVLGAVVATAAMTGSAVQPEPQVDLDVVNAKIDARLHTLLAAQIAKRQ